MDDLSNTADVLGAAAGADILGRNWVAFDNPMRGWALEGSSAFDAAARGECLATSGACRMFDARPAEADQVIRNMTGGWNGSAWVGNEPFVAGAPCPSAVHGDRVVSAHGRTWLLNATEIVGDYVGDENGLCESGEACIYAPNFGAYQGRGDPKTAGTCVFQGGAVNNVLMYAHPING